MKRPFLLLEVLIAIALVALCAYPLISPHYRLAGEKQSAIRRLQLERGADEAFCEVQERLYKGEVSWDAIIKPTKAKPRAILSLTPLTISVSEKEETYTATAVLTTKEKHAKGKRKYFRLFDIAIALRGNTDLTYHYSLYAERLGPEG